MIRIYILLAFDAHRHILDQCAVHHRQMQCWHSISNGKLASLCWRFDHFLPLYLFDSVITDCFLLTSASWFVFYTLYVSFPSRIVLNVPVIQMQFDSQSKPCIWEILCMHISSEIASVFVPFWSFLIRMSAAHERENKKERSDNLMQSIGILC